FYWNTKVTALDARKGRIGGVTGTNLRTGDEIVFEGQAVVLATGGYESNLEMVRRYWPKHLGKVPERVVLGSGTNSQGSGMNLARSAGGALRNMDHQWIYPRGIPDPMHLSEGRGLYTMVAASIYLNRRGKRFMDEMSATTDAVRAMMAQPGGTYWMLFDEGGANSVFAAGIDWQDKQKVRREIVNNEAVVKTAATLEETARKAGLPPAEVRASVERWNRAVDSGLDEQFKKKISIALPDGRSFTLSKIEKGPFHLMQIYPLSRKSMGGIHVDLNSRVLNREGKPIAGLYAVGETTGEGGLNGRAALEGTFLGPSIVQGHMAAAHLASTIRLASRQSAPIAATKPAPPTPARAVSTDCRQCHQMDRLLTAKRPGYWHFERLHAVVASRGYECKSCHAEMSPYRYNAHRIDRVAQIGVCTTCHLLTE
ncbi:MAG: FAD-binding protein, partial [Acidobacteriota bacterium]